MLILTFVIFDQVNGIKCPCVPLNVQLILFYWTYHGSLIRTINCFVATSQSSFCFIEIIWHNWQTLSILFPYHLYQESRWSKWSLFNIQNAGVVISFFPMFIHFVVSFECFFFVASSIHIKNPYIEKCPLSMPPKPSSGDISLYFHWYFSTYWFFFSSQRIIVISALF